MEREGIHVLQTAVGDRYVLEEMRAGGYSLGGEQSGHVILLDHGTTGDGVLTGLMLAARIVQTGRSIADLGTVMTRLPQVLVNVKGVDTSRVESDEHLRSAVHAEQATLDGSGRVLLRKSGTEPLVRVMVEAPTQEQADAVADRLAGRGPGAPAPDPCRVGGGGMGCGGRGWPGWPAARRRAASRDPRGEPPCRTSP